MNNAIAMRVFDCITNLSENIFATTRREPLFLGDQILQTAALQKVHNKIRLPIFYDAIKNRDDVWMIKTTESLHLALKPLQQHRIREKLHLQSFLSRQCDRLILASLYRRHSYHLAKRVENLVAPAGKLCANQWILIG